MGSVEGPWLLHADLCKGLNEIEVLDGAIYDENSKMMLVVYENGTPKFSLGLDKALFETLHEDINIMFERMKNRGSTFAN